MSRAGEAAVQSRARRQRGHWLCAVTPRGAAAAASADWRAGRRVHAARAVPKPLCGGLAPPPNPPGTITPPLCPALQMKHLGPLPAAVPARPPGLTERARKARSQLGRTHRALRALQQLLSGRCAPPRHVICISHNSGQSVSVSREADGFCLGGREWLAAHAQWRPTGTKAFIAVVYFHPLPSCSLSLSFFFPP